MKKIVTLACAFSFVMGVGAQTIYDAAKFADKDLTGTARFVGMGGAMGALGGDITTMSTNPAGIGIYRSNEVMTTFGLSKYGLESNYQGANFKKDNFQGSFDNIGFVFALKIGNQTPVRYVNFGFNYRRTNSLYKNMTMEGLMGAYNGILLSQANQMAQQDTDNAPYLEEDYGSEYIYENADAGWLGAMGYNGWLVNKNVPDDPSDNNYSPIVPSEANSLFNSRERGGINEYNFNVAFNVNDRVYLGVTLGAHEVDYNKTSSYDEAYDTGEGYLLDSYNKMTGTGYDVKLGAIFRPFESSPFRIGVALHSPTFYKMTYTTSARLESDYLVEDGSMQKAIVDTYDYVGDMKSDFNLVTPWTYNVNLGYTVGSSLALGAEYEYEDYSTMKFKYGDGSGDKMEWETGEADLNLKGMHTFRLGAEYKVVPQFAIRAGYNYNSSVFKDEAVKYLPSNSIMTDTDFANKQSQNTYTLGIGYRGDSFYADLAYKYSAYNENFYPFMNEIEEADGGWSIVTPPATKVTNTRSQVMLTLGFRF